MQFYTKKGEKASPEGVLSLFVGLFLDRDELPGKVGGGQQIGIVVWIMRYWILAMPVETDGDGLLRGVDDRGRMGWSDSGLTCRASQAIRVFLGQRFQSRGVSTFICRTNSSTVS